VTHVRESEEKLAGVVGGVTGHTDHGGANTDKTPEAAGEAGRVNDSIHLLAGVVSFDDNLLIRVNRRHRDAGAIESFCYAAERTL
jgi:hypothetical protein